MRRLGYIAAAALPIAILSSCLLPSFDNVAGSPFGGGSGGASPEAGPGPEGGAPGEAGEAGGNSVAPVPVPVPVADVYSMLQGATLTVPAPGVLENDAGSSLVVDAVDDSDANRPKKYDAASLRIDADGTLKFQPEVDFFGTYSLVYTVRDKDGVAAQASVKINVQPVNASLATVRDGVGGFVIDGDASDAIGGAVAAAGDVNHDGFDDILIGAPTAGTAGAGRAYVVYGRANSAKVALKALPTKSSERTFFELDGIAGDGAGNSVAGIGDINGDKLADFAVAASNGNGGLGSVYVVFGGALSGGLPLGGPGATPGAVLTGKSVPIGALISHAGDVNNDGIPDLLVSGLSSPVHNGSVFAVLGAETLKSAAIDDVPNLLIQSADKNDLTPQSLDYVGNVDGADGDEIAMTNRSSVIMVRGTAPGGAYPSTTGPLSGSGDSGGGWLYGLQNQTVMAAVAGAGDVDADPAHSADLLICEADTAGTTMACRVVLSPPKSLSAGWNLVGFKALPHLSHGADINGDGHSDLLFGEAAKAYAVFGRRPPLPDVDVTALGDAGFTLNTENAAQVDSVTTLGDVNGDGVLDYAVGVSSASQGAGSVYVLFGSKSGG
jgi:hypothetical protein